MTYKSVSDIDIDVNYEPACIGSHFVVPGLNELLRCDWLKLLLEFDRVTAG